MGLLLVSFLPISCDMLVIPIAAAIALVMKFFFRMSTKEILTVLIILALAAGYYRLYSILTYDRLADKCGKEVSFTGSIIDTTEYRDDNCRYHVKGELDGISGAEMYIYAPSAEVLPDDTVHFTGTVKEFENGFLFDSKDYYKSKGIYLQADKITYLDVETNDDFSLTRLMYDYRTGVTDFIKSELSEDDGSLLLGMLFGDKSGISGDDKTLFYNTGIGHVMAVSGLHLVLFCSVFTYLFGLLRIGRKLRFVLLEAIMLLFALCSGMSVSVLRAAFMMTLVNLSPLFIRQTDTLTSVGAAFILLTLKCPFAVRDPSLLLSVTGVISMGVFAPYMTAKMPAENRRQKLIKNGAFFLFLWTGIFPMSVMCFGESSFISPIANMILTPICMAALFLGIISSLFVFLSPAFLVKAAGLLCHIVIKAVRFVGRFSFSSANFGFEVKIVVAVLVLSAVILLIKFRSRKILLASIGASAAVILSTVGVFKFIGRNDIRIAVMGKKSIDVIAAEIDGKCYIADISGSKSNVRYVREYLSRRNIRNIDNIIIMNKPYQAMSAYDSGLGLVDVEGVFMPEDTILRDDQTICGCAPEFTSDVSLGDITVNGTRIEVKQGDFSFVCDSSLNDEKADVYAEYDNIFDPPLCSSVIVPEYDNKDDLPDIYTETNLLIRADSGGKYCIGGM